MREAVGERGQGSCHQLVRAPPGLLHHSSPPSPLPCPPGWCSRRMGAKLDFRSKPTCEPWSPSFSLPGAVPEPLTSKDDAREGWPCHAMAARVAEPFQSSPR